MFQFGGYPHRSNEQRLIIVCRRSSQELPMKVAYEQVRLQPSGDLAMELAQGILEDELDQLNKPDFYLNYTQDQEANTNFNFN